MGAEQSKKKKGEQSEELKKALEKANTLPKDLHLSYTRLSFAEWKELMPLIQNNPNLEKLNLYCKPVR